MRTNALVIAALALATAALPGTAAGNPPGVDNGFVIMIHGHVDTALKDAPVPYPRPIEAVTAGRDGDAFELAVIPYAVWTERPEQVWDTELVVTRTDGSEIVLAPLDGFGRSREVCEVETSLKGHEGDVEACEVFRIPADQVPPGGIVTLEFRFRWQDQVFREPYSAVSHSMIHGAAEGGSGSFADADQRAEPTPYVLSEDVP